MTTILLSCMFITYGYAMTHIRIEKTNNSDELIQLNTIRNIQFQGENVQFKLKNGDIDLFSVTSIKSLKFSSIPSGIENNNASGEIFFYPNPATDYIYLKNMATQEANINIYQIDGVLVLSGTQSLHQPIYIGGLAKGFYLLQVNRQTFKFRKL